MTIEFKKLAKNAKIPNKNNNGDSAFKFYCLNIVKKANCIEYHTGIAINVPENMIGILLPNDDVVDKDLMFKNSVGLIEYGNHDEIVFIYNDSKQYSITQKKSAYDNGDCVGRVVFVNTEKIMLWEVEDFENTL